MYGFIVNRDSNHNTKRFGDKLILTLYNEDITSKYQIFGREIFLETNRKFDEKLEKRFSISPATMTKKKKKNIYSNITKVIDRVNEPESFAIKVIRKGEHKYTSTELARNVAGAVFDKWPKIKVNLEKPQLKIIIQIINNRSLIYIRD